ncbi:MAG: hypothetical protein JWM07_539 [Candidatus Saccharibacteria bacterium]|jgi:hypothetical protein|nr:hypothetical protein [Candidatus Saccharibacteria bacterium]
MSTVTSSAKSSTVIYTDIKDSEKAGIYIGEYITKAFDNKPADAVIIFASSSHDYASVLKSITTTCNPKILLGCSSAGEFISEQHGEGAISAIAFRSDHLQFSVGLGINILGDPDHAAQEVVESFGGMTDTSFPYRSALVLADALAGHTDELIDHLNKATAGTYQFFGGGAGDDAKFSKTHVFLGTKIYTNAVVALEILSKKPIGIGVRHGWKQSSVKMRVTESDGAKLVSLNSIPILNVLQKHAENTNQKFDEKNPIPFFLHNVIGIETPNGYKLRVPLSINNDGSVNCASDIPQGTIVSIMKTDSESASNAAREATEDALRQVGNHEPGVALLFDCVATRLRTGQEFEYELDTVTKKLQPAVMAGCNTYGQIARVDGQFNGFHNCTAVVCVIPS